MTAAEVKLGIDQTETSTKNVGTKEEYMRETMWSKNGQENSMKRVDGAPGTQRTRSERDQKRTA